VVRAADHEDRDAVLGLDRLEDGAALLLQVVSNCVERLPGLWCGVVALVLGDAEARAPGVEHAPRGEVDLAEGERVVEVLDAALAKKSTSLVNAAFITSGTPATMGQLVLSITFSPKEGTCVRTGRRCS
jgi:hypothetical protein